MEDLDPFFGTAGADTLALPEGGIEVVGVGDFALGLAAGQVVDAVARRQFAAAGVFGGQALDPAQAVLFDAFADQQLQLNNRLLVSRSS